MRSIRLLLVVLLALSVPMGALAALLDGGHCRVAPGGDAGGHAMHDTDAADDEGISHPAADAAGCECGCACIGVDCVPGGAAMAIGADPSSRSASIAAEFHPPPTLALRAHTRGLLRPPSTN